MGMPLEMLSIYVGDSFDDVPQDVVPLSRGCVNITIVQ